MPMRVRLTSVCIPQGSSFLYSFAFSTSTKITSQVNNILCYFSLKFKRRPGDRKDFLSWVVVAEQSLKQKNESFMVGFQVMSHLVEGDKGQFVGPQMASFPGPLR